MKKLSSILLAIALLGGNNAFAQTGQGANASSNAGSDGVSWGIGLGMLAVLGTVVGVTVASAVSGPSSFSH